MIRLPAARRMHDRRTLQQHSSFSTASFRRRLGSGEECASGFRRCHLNEAQADHQITGVFAASADGGVPATDDGAITPEHRIV